MNYELISNTDWSLSTIHYPLLTSHSLYPLFPNLYPLILYISRNNALCSIA